MNLQAAGKWAAEILICYYEKDRGTFLDACNEQIVWIGPKEEQIVSTKEALKLAFDSEAKARNARFSDFSVTPIPTASNRVCEIVITGTLEEEWEGGRRERRRQRAVLTLAEQKKEYEILVCHISDVSGWDGQKRSRTSGGLSASDAVNGTRIQVKSIEKEILFLNCSDILYLKTARNHTIIYTVNGCHESVENLRTLEQRCPMSFIRCHSSYLVNTGFVTSVRRFRVTLADGTELPIPEKKYMAVKAVFQKYCGGTKAE